MPMPRPSRLSGVWVLVSFCALAHAAVASPPVCTQVTVEGEVRYGQSYTAPITHDLYFKLEAIPSGWIVRVLPVSGSRPPHDYAELATPPYASLTPLAIGTDWSFRAQDAIGWNPRHFRFAQDSAVFQRMESLYAPAMNDDARAAAELAKLAAAQPAARITLLGAKLLPGTNDQTGTAARVVSHWESTPHSIESGAGTPLGRIADLRFRATFALLPGMHAAAGGTQRKGPCEE